MQPPNHDTTPPTQLKPPISRAGLRQIGRLSKLKNECNNTTKHHPEISNNADLNPIHRTIKITQILQPTTPLTTIEAQRQCSRNIGTIINKAGNTLSDKIRDKENKRYDKSPKHYHNNLKIHAVLIPRARDQPWVTSLTKPTAKQIHTTPKEVIDIVTSHYEKEHQRATPEHLTAAPWTQPKYPDNFGIKPPTPYTTPQPSETLTNTSQKATTIG